MVPSVVTETQNNSTNDSAPVYCTCRNNATVLPKQNKTAKYCYRYNPWETVTVLQ